MAYLSGDGRYADRQTFPFPDLILLDLKMPGKDGFDVLEWMRKQKRFEKLPVIAMSSFDARALAEKITQLGANGFFVKNADANVLGSALINLFSKALGSQNLS
jgi:two-component system response regulator